MKQQRSRVPRALVGFTARPAPLAPGGRRCKHTLRWGGKREWGGRVDIEAAEAFGADEPLKVETVRLEGPKAGEVPVELSGA